MTSCESLVKTFLRGLESQFHVEAQGENICAITVPLETPGGDAIHVYVDRQGDRFVLSDEGETLGNVFMFNVNPEGEAEDYLRATLARYGARNDNGAIVMSGAMTSFRQTFLAYINCLQNLSALELRKRAEQAKRFDVKVRSTLDLRHVPFSRTFRPRLGTEELPVDFASLNETVVFLALGTVNAGQLPSYLRSKLYSFSELKAHGLEDKFQRVAIMDQETSWSPEAEAAVARDAHEVYRWPDQVADVEVLLRSNAEPRRIA